MKKKEEENFQQQKKTHTEKFDNNKSGFYYLLPPLYKKRQILNGIENKITVLIKQIFGFENSKIKTHAPKKKRSFLFEFSYLTHFISLSKQTTNININFPEPLKKIFFSFFFGG